MTADLYHGGYDEPMFTEEADALLSDGGATCEIASAFPAAQKVEARELRVGDQLFDAFGGTHEIVEKTQRRGWVDTIRHDGWHDRFHQHDTVTIIRPREAE